MVKLVKSAVKCYKKKTKKTVNGKKKTYQYNQYLVPLKRSDDLECSMEVFVVSQEDLEELLDEEGNLSDEIIGRGDYYNQQINAYERELAELEWKHGELSRTYKEQVSKNTKVNHKRRKYENEIKDLQEENQTLSKDLKLEKNQHQDLKKKYEDMNEKSKILEEELSKQKGDFWSVFKNRLAKNEKE